MEREDPYPPSPLAAIYVWCRWSEVTELLEEGLVTQEEVEQMWENLPKVANSINAAGAAGVEKGTLINFQGFLEFDRQVMLLIVLPFGGGNCTSSRTTRTTA